VSESHSISPVSPETIDALVAVLGGLTLVDGEAQAAGAPAPEIRQAQNAVHHATEALGRAVSEVASSGSATDETLRDAVGALADASRLVERARRTIVTATAAYR
jgi:hypothetical protein